MAKLTLTMSALYLAAVGLALMFFPLPFGTGTESCCTRTARAPAFARRTVPRDRRTELAVEGCRGVSVPPGCACENRGLVLPFKPENLLVRAP